MSTMTARTAVATAFLLAGCDSVDSPLGPPRATHVATPQNGPLIAFVQSDAHCGVGMSAGCGDDGGWGWSWWSGLVTVEADGSNRKALTWSRENGDDTDPAWAPDGSRLAFTRGGEIRVTSGVIDSETNLTNHAAHDAEPTWSPDGARIAFASDRSGLTELYVMDAATGANVRRLTNGVGVAGRPDWSPDGTRIAFDCTVESGNVDICVVSPDGTGFVRLTSDAGFDGAADWSRAGEIAFVTSRFGSTSEIAVMNGDGSAVRRVAPGITAVDPDWSPDDTRILFATNFDIYAMQSDGTNPTWLASGANVFGTFHLALQPTWRPGDTPWQEERDEVPQARIDGMTCWPLNCTFNDGSWDDHGIVSRVWTFGDGTRLTLYEDRDPTHTYAAAGPYDVTLSVTDAVGHTSSVTTHVDVFGPPPPPNQAPVASFTASCIRTKCTFDGRASTDDAGVVSWAWKLGNQQRDTASGAIATVDYRRSGSYTVTLTVRDAAGLTNSMTRTIDVVK
jgi:dipeptidyl aminopeptidase/acylaminoacyl peptidase